MKPKRSSTWTKPLIAGAAILLLAAMVGTAVVTLAGTRRPVYSQDSPDDVVQSAIAMVRNGDARFLGDLLYADSDDMRATLNRLGVLLDHMQTLAIEIKKQFPADVEKLRSEVEKDAQAGKAPPIFAALTQGRAGRPGAGGAGRAGPDQEEIMKSIVARLFSDPYGWIEQNESRLSTARVTDDTATVLVDNAPVAGVGIPMRLEKGKWYIALPTNMPPLSRVMPRAPEQWRMFNSLIKLLDNTVLELADDVKQGRLRNLGSIGDKAQEKIIFPGALWVAAYSADLDARGRIDRARMCRARSSPRRSRRRSTRWPRGRSKPRSGPGSSPSRRS
jgi:hypothetical protein